MQNTSDSSRNVADGKINKMFTSFNNRKNNDNPPNRIFSGKNINLLKNQMIAIFHLQNEYFI